MKRFVLSGVCGLLALAMLVGCAGPGAVTKYGPENYPNSFLAEWMAKYNVHPETVARRFGDAVTVEIEMGTLQEDKALAWIDEQRSKVKRGITYGIGKEIIDRYFARYVNMEDKGLKRAILYLRALVVPEIRQEIKDKVMLADDTRLVLRLFDYVEARIKGEPLPEITAG